MNTVLLVLSTVFTGLMAGLFYAWSISVTPGLAKIGDESFLQAFQAMNRAILNPVFFIAFMGLIVLLPLVLYLNFNPSGGRQFWFILSATILYLGGVFLITAAGNVPLNNELEALTISAMSAEQMQNFRLGFEQKWVRLNTIRTFCSILSFVLMVLACLPNITK